MTREQDFSAALQHLLDAAHPPSPDAGPGQIPWHDPDFSRRMLKVHLDPETDMASRRPDLIQHHLDWLTSQPGLDQPGARILDVGCGPGLYNHELARRGYRSVGFDFAPAPLAWARDTAAAEGLDCTFLDADLTDLPPDFPAQVGPLDAITFWFGEFNTFDRDQAAAFLPRLAACLKPGGLFVLEYQPWDIFVQEASTQWKMVPASVFADTPHLWLQEYGWDEALAVETHVHWILDQKSGTLQRYVQRHHAFTDEELVSLLSAAGLVEPMIFPPITGQTDEFEFPVVVTRRPQI